MSDIQIIKKNPAVRDARNVGTYSFLNGNKVSIFEVESVYGLTKLLGYAKFINRQYGEVLYRGECKLHPTLMPSLLRDTEHTEKLFKELNAIVSETMDAESMKNFLKVDEIHDEEEKRSYVEKVKRSIVEGMLQHYGIPTRFIDLVDNHWVALWMCLNSCVTYSLGKDSFGKRTVCKYQSRYRNLYDIILSQDKLDDDKDDNLYGFLLLVCLPSDESGKRTFGVSESTDFIRIDLRQALPSAFCAPMLNMASLQEKS